MKISKNINEAIFWLNQNKVIAIPTETVYGLAANIFDEKAVKSIYEIKGRPSNNPLIVHIKSEDELNKYVTNIPEKADLLIKKLWPGSLTLILPKKNIIPKYITCGKDTVAIRVPSHPLTLSLLNKLDFPLAAPSANPSNRVSSTKISHIQEYFDNKIPFALDGGECENGLESTIVSFIDTEPVILRLGSVSQEDIEKIIGTVKIKNHSNSEPITPGMFSKHYSPQTPLFVINDYEFLEKTEFTKIAYISINEEIKHKKIKKNFLLSPTSNLNEAAKNLYKTLIEIDQQDFDAILTKSFPNEYLGKTINDRLKRASTK